MLASDRSATTNTANVQENAAAGSHGRERNKSLSRSRNVLIIAFFGTKLFHSNFTRRRPQGGTRARSETTLGLKSLNSYRTEASVSSRQKRMRTRWNHRPRRRDVLAALAGHSSSAVKHHWPKRCWPTLVRGYWAGLLYLGCDAISRRQAGFIGAAAAG